ncbi:MAG: FGGY family carbohydrate kinase [Eubacteriales bacterium]|nr:FGGY family carbohydrate kinase [Eubacteriales bacterium]
MDVIGLDIGTSSISAVLVNANTGTLRKVMTLANTAGLSSAQPFEAIQSPKVILDSCQRLVRALADESDGVGSIGIASQMHGILYLGVRGQPVSPLYTWQDERGNCKFDQHETYCEALNRMTGSHIATGYGLATHFYNVRNNLVPPTAACICGIGDYVAAAMTGVSRPVMHRSMAASIGLFNVRESRFNMAVMRRCGIDAELLPAVTAEETVVGYHPSGVPVCCAMGDNQCSVFGACNEIATLHINIGTGGQISAIVDEPENAPGMECRPYIGGRYLLVGSPLCSGEAYAILRDFFADTARMLGMEREVDVYERMQKAAQLAYDSEKRLLADTRFRGTRDNPRIRGRITNISRATFTPEQLVLAILRGIADELHDIYLEAGISRPAFIACSGNGLRKNIVMRRILADRFGLPLQFPRYQEEAAFGAAIIGAAAAGVLPDLMSAQDLVCYQ